MTNFVKKNQDVILIAVVIGVIYFAFFNEGKSLFGKSEAAPLPEGNGGNGNGEGSDYALGNYPPGDRQYLDKFGAALSIW